MSSIDSYINSNGYLDVPKDILDTKTLDQWADVFRNVPVPFPTKMMLLGDKRQTMFQNLMNYRPEMSFTPETYKCAKWQTKKATNKYLGRPLSFISNQWCYDNIDQLTDYFTEFQRLSAYRFDQNISPLEFWERRLVDIVDISIKDLDTLNSNSLRESLWRTGTETTSFKLSLVSSILWQFDAKRILDISAGWGDRLLGAIAHYAERYLGYDPNIALKAGHDEIIEYFTKDRTTSKPINQYEVRYEPFETANIGTELFDLVFTSPPYFELEIYTNLPGQSIDTFMQFNDWLVSFLFVSLHKSWQHLKVEGNMVIHLCDYSKKQLVEPMVLFVLGWCPSSSFSGVIGSIGDSHKTRPLWVFKNTGRSSGEEKTAQEELKKYYPQIYTIVRNKF